jgi:hypothetical protein
VRKRAPDAFGDSTQLPVPADVPAVVPDVVTSVDGKPDRTQRLGPVDDRVEYDPLRLCIYTTIGLIAWLITPALTVAIFGTIGVIGYWRARRRGLASSRCYLGDTRLVIAYLALAALGGAAWTIWRLVR